MDNTVMKEVIVLGSTGSIGVNALKVLAEHHDRFRVVGLAAGDNISRLTQQIEIHRPKRVSVKTKGGAEKLRAIFAEQLVGFGEEGLLELVQANPQAYVVSAIEGTAALSATLHSIHLNQRLCMANKEMLVAAGELINRELAGSRAEIIPIDSEQSAIFQCLDRSRPEFVRRVILTASGGPFWQRPKEDFWRIPPEEALAHPVWAMGKKITIDSATMMNKALEIIEAFHLFHLNSDQIEVVIHPQSIVHSLVEFVDTSMLAQLSLPDMRIPILYSLTHPERFPGDGGPGVDLAKLGTLDFFPPDVGRFPSLAMARSVLASGKNAGAVFQSANEMAVQAYLNKKIPLAAIFQVVAKMLEREHFYPLHSVADVLATIEETKIKTNRFIEQEVIR